MKGIGSGLFERKIKIKENEVKVFFQFGTLASAYTERLSKMGIFDLFQEVANGHGSLSMIHYFYGGILAYQNLNGLKETTLQEFMEIWDAMDDNVILDLYILSTKQPEPKNALAPKMAGQKVEH